MSSCNFWLVKIDRNLGCCLEKSFSEPFLRKLQFCILIPEYGFHILKLLFFNIFCRLRIFLVNKKPKGCFASKSITFIHLLNFKNKLKIKIHFEEFCFPVFLTSESKNANCDGIHATLRIRTNSDEFLT